MADRRHRLVLTRKAAGFSQEERLAETVGVERTTVMRWERGETCPQPWARPKLARALGISDEALSELLSELAEPEGAGSAPAQIAEELIPLHRRDFLKYSVVFPTLGFDELRHLSLAVNDAMDYLDTEVVGYFKQQLDSCATNDGIYGP